MSAAPLQVVGALLGTAVFRWNQPVAAAVLISDLHVPSDGGAAFAHLQDAVAAARQAQRPLFVLGDLFDSYVSAAQVRTGIWRDTAALFGAAVAGGSPVVILHGNRDFLLGAEFERASGARVVAGALRVALAGVETLLAHGDELCQRDLPYQRAKRWLRHPVTRFVGRHLPLSLALSLAERARRRSRAVIASGDQSRFLPTAAAVAAAFADGVQQLVFGHIHRHATGEVGGGRYRVLPAFDQDGVGLLADDRGLRPVRFLPGGQVEPVDEPGPCPFPAA
ncbi:MAG: UDP-2,3-diacylglucosamine diphosphatase [Planctomycetes bacterium]|nr:UDP-2,3-diacylglucosamine diphosphatase [Planctomycetota bacterium]